MLSLTALTCTALYQCNTWDTMTEAEALYITTKISIKSTKVQVLRSSSFWKAWHIIFHSIMIPTFAFKTTKAFIDSGTRVIALAIIEMLIPNITQAVYWHAIARHIYITLNIAALEITLGDINGG